MPAVSIATRLRFLQSFQAQHDRARTRIVSRQQIVDPPRSPLMSYMRQVMYPALSGVGVGRVQILGRRRLGTVQLVGARVRPAPSCTSPLFVPLLVWQLTTVMIRVTG